MSWLRGGGAGGSGDPFVGRFRVEPDSRRIENFAVIASREAPIAGFALRVFERELTDTASSY